MFNKINLSKIIIDHFRTFKDARSSNVSFFEIITYIFFPFGASCIIVLYFNLFLSDSLISVLITALSILIGLLLNLLVILFDITGKVDVSDPKRELKKEILKETYSNVSFAILISLIDIGFLVLAYKDALWMRVPANILALLFFGMFLYTLLMILKRTHSLLSEQFS